MTDVVVTQADRDAAADYLRAVPMANTLLCVRVREGSEDHALVQAFARHRLASHTPVSGSIGELVKRWRAMAHALRGRNDLNAAHYLDEAAETCTSLQARADRLEEEKAALRNALGPFADKATLWEVNHPHGGRDSQQVTHRLGDFRAARTAITESYRAERLAEGLEERPFAYCCAEGGGRVEHCCCVNPQHGTAWFRTSGAVLTPVDQVPGK